MAIQIRRESNFAANIYLYTTMTQTLSSKPHYEILDGLRGVAAFIIVIYHLCEGCGIMLGHGYLGVDFFYALSGFVIGYAYDDRLQKGMTTSNFLKRRIIRLHPMVLMGTLIGLLFYYFGECAAFPLIGNSPWWTVLLLFFYCCLMLPMPNSWDIRGWQDFNSFNGNIWSLYWEYLANILYITLFHRLPTIVLVVLTGIAACLTLDLTLNIDCFGLLSARVGAPFTVNGGWSITSSELYVGAVRLLFPFLCGLVISRLHKFISIKRAFLWCSILVVSLLLYPQHDGLANGLYEATTILFFVPLTISIGAGSHIYGKQTHRFCKFLGDISYPLYITHLPFIYMQIAWRSQHPDAPKESIVFLSIAIFFISLGTAYACLKLYDIPVRNWLKKHWNKKS